MGLQAMMPASQLYSDLFPGTKLADSIVELLLNYIDNSWLKFWPVELEKKIFRVSTRDLEDQHIKFLKEFKEQSMTKKVNQSDIKAIMMYKFEPHPQSPNKLILIEILLLHKLSILTSTLYEDKIQLAHTLSDVSSLTKAMMFYLDFEFIDDQMVQRRCQYTYITMLISVLSALVDCYGQLSNDQNGINLRKNEENGGLNEEGNIDQYQNHEEVSSIDLIYYTTRDIIDFLKLCLSISYQANKKIFDDAPKPKASENKFFSSMPTGGKIEDIKPICVVVAKQILKMTNKTDEKSSSDSPIKFEPISKKGPKGGMFGGKKPNLLDLNSGIDVTACIQGEKEDLLLDKEEVLNGLPNSYSKEDKLIGFLSKFSALNTHEIRQQYLTRLSINSLQLRADFNEYLTTQRASISDNIESSLRLESRSTSRRLKVPSQ